MGRTRNKDAEKLFAEINRQRKLAAERLEKAAKLGMAQAVQEWALAQEEPGDAHPWHQKAADLGLAEGMRYAGLQLVLGQGVEKDPDKGVALSEKAAAKGDVYAMVNLAVFHDRGVGVKKDAARAQHWLDAADKTGHWYGGIERGMSLLTGDYATKTDREKGVLVLQKAIESGNGEALTFIATSYAKGIGLKRDGKKAVSFAEAAYRQGGTSAAGVLGHVYSEGVRGVEPDEEQAGFWGREASKPGFGIQLLDEKSQTEFFRHIDGIDPFKLKID
jgi:TPR repeat protein